jgi:rare lipoprotein A
MYIMKRAFTQTFFSAFLIFIVGHLGAFETEGFASWYGGKFQGRKTASGEIFDTNKLTAAHKSLAFGTKVRVTDAENGKSVIVRINDRGPFVEERIIDLSRAAADSIGLTPRGVGKVRLEVVEEEPKARFGTIQVASFGSEDNARRLRNKLFEAALTPSVESTEGGLFRVLLEHVPTEELDEVREKLAGLGYSRVVVRYN